MAAYADPIERRDTWRAIWRAITSDALLIALSAIVAVGLIAALALPQEPGSGIADPMAYSRWEAAAKQREGPFYSLFNGLGLNSAYQAAWWRIALVSAGTLAGLRLADRVARVFEGRRSRTSGLNDERRVRVTLDAPALPSLAAALQTRRYRVMQPGDDALVADRTPLAESLSIALHLGLIAVAIGLLMNLTLGWEALGRAVAPGLPSTMHGDLTIALDDSGNPPEMRLLLGASGTPFTLAPGQGVRAGGIDLVLQKITPGYRLSATAGDGSPVMIRASNFVSPTTEVLISFTEDNPERYVAVPDARLALALSAGTAPDHPGRLRIFSVPDGAVLGDMAIQPDVTTAGTTFRFSPARGAVIDARYRPGQPLVWLGLALVAIGAIGSLLFPMRRIVVRHHGHWTEFYASGRGVRDDVNALLT
jgi:hypothetical protein